jgi:hypothetical protein
MSQMKITDIEHAVDIMDVSMFPSTIMNIVFGHRYFGTIKNSGLNSKSGLISSNKKGKLFYLIHIIPNVNIGRTLRPSPLSIDWLDFEHSLPPVPCSRVEEICPRAVATPTPTFVFTFTALWFDKEL